MLEKLAKQSAIYGISTIVGRLLGYLLTPYFTRIFSPAAYGVITDVYAVIPFALVLLSMGMESSYFRFATKAEGEADVQGAMNRLFSTTWGVTSAAAVGFVALVMLFINPACRVMGEAYVQNPLYIQLVALIIMFDVAAMIPFVRLRQQGRAKEYVMLKLLNISLQVGFSIGFGFMGLYSSEFGVGWALVANLVSTGVTFVVILFTLRGVKFRADGVLLGALLVYSLPLLLSGIAATATDFIDRQMIKYIIPEGAMAQLGIYGAVTKIAVMMTLFTQMYRLAAEPFFLSNFKKEEFKETNAAAMKYYVMVSVLIFLGISLFRNLFALIVGVEYREGVYILPVVLGANIFMGVWLNLSFWYKREERTSFALYITLTGLAVAVVSNLVLIPRWGYYGAAWSRFIAEGAMVAVSYYLNRRFFPTPYDLGRMAEYVALGLGLFYVSEWLSGVGEWYVVNSLLLGVYLGYAVWRENIDVRGLINSVLRR
ncbi:MAG: polysaccharide biosynthesis C-terminal domain-containing protein [Rikenellaceae bacterium]